MIARSMSSKKFLLLIFIFLISQFRMSAQVTLVDNNSGSYSFSLCSGQGDFTLNLATTLPSIPLCTLCITLPPDFTYMTVPAISSNIPAVQITPCTIGCGGSLCFTIDPATYTGTTLEIYFHITGSCALTANNPTDVYTTNYALNWSGGNTTASSNFSVRFPRLEVTQATDVINITNFTTLQRTIIITNTGNEIYDPSNSSYGPFTIKDDHSVGINAGSITAGPFRDFANNILPGGISGGNVYTLPVTQAVLNAILDAQYGAGTCTVIGYPGSGLPCAAFTIKEDIIGNQCFLTPPEVDSRIEVAWSCGGTPCQDDERIAQNVSTVLAPIITSPLHGYYGTYDACYGQNNLSHVQLSFFNSNSALSTTATNLELTLEKDLVNPSYTDIITASIRVYDDATDITALVTITPSGAGANNPITACDGVQYPNKFVISNIPNLAKNHTLKFQWDVRTCCPAQTCTDPVARKDLWKYALEYGGFCDGHITTLNPNPVNVIPAGSAGLPGNVAYEGPTTIDVDPLNPPNITYPVSFQVSTLPVWGGNLNNQQFVIHLTLGPNLTFVDPNAIFISGPSIAGNLLPAIVCHDPVAFGVVEEAWLIYDYAQIGNNVANLNGSEVHYEMFGECPDGIGANFVGYEIYHIPDIMATCTPGASCHVINYPTVCGLPPTKTAILLSCLQVPLTFHCPGCLRQGIHSLGYELRRTTYGFEDHNNNGRWDGGTPTTITTGTLGTNPGVKTRRMMVGDEFEGVLHTSIVKDGNYGPPPATMDPFLFGYWRAGFDCADNLNLVDMELGIVGVQAIMTVNVLPGYTPAGLQPALPFDIPINYIGITPINTSCPPPPGHELYYDFSVSVLQANWAIKYPGAAYPTQLNEFINGTELDFRHRMIQRENVCNTFVPCQNNNTIYLGLRAEVLGSSELVDPDAVAFGFTSIGDYADYCDGTMTNINHCGYTPATCDDFQWYCTHQGATYNQVGFSYVGGIAMNPGVGGNNCGYGTVASKGFYDGPGSWTSPGNNFPFEYRHWNHFDRMVITMPPGYHFNNSYWEEWSNAGYQFLPNWACNPPFTQAANLVTFDYTNNLYNTGGEATAPVEQRLMDDSYQMQLASRFIPDCSADGPGTFTFTVTDYFASQMGIATGCYIIGPDQDIGTPGIQRTTVINQNITPVRIRPQLALQTTPAYGLNGEVCWNVLLSNTAPAAGASANNLWVAFDWLSSSSIMSTGGIISMSYLGNPLRDGAGNIPASYLPNQLYYLPGAVTLIPQGTALTIQICTYFDCSLAEDHLNIFSGYNCFPSYLTQPDLCGQPLPQFNTVQDYTNYNCIAAFEQLIALPQNPDLNICINNTCTTGTPVSAEFCTDVTYTLSIQNTGFSNAHGIHLQIDWPIVAGYFVSATATYNGNTVPLFPSSNQLVVDINSMPAFSPIDVNGLPGFQQLVIDGAADPDAESRIVITYIFHINCNFSYTPSDNMHIAITADPDDCPGNMPYDNYINPILESPNSQFDNLSTDIQVTPFAGCTNTTQGSITITNLANHISNGVNNFLFLTLPPGFTANNFSVTPLPGAPFYHWSAAALGGILDISNSPNNVLTITFDLHYNQNVSCGIHDMHAHIQAIDDIFCNGIMCNHIDILESEDVVQVVVPLPDASFNCPSPGETLCVNQPYTLIGTSGCPYNLWNIDYGAFYSTSATLNYSFTTPGLHHVCHSVAANPFTPAIPPASPACSDMECCDIMVLACDSDSCAASANFSWSVENCNVYFTDLSTAAFPNVINGWYWNLGDGNFTTVQNPVHTYPANGTYHVCLYVYVIDFDACPFDTLCMDSICQDIKIGDCYPTDCKVKACFDVGVEQCKAYFKDCSEAAPGTTIYSWLWSFGDGHFSTSQNPVHTYTTPGIYTVCLWVWGFDGKDYCYDYVCKQVAIREDCKKEDCKVAACFKYKVDGCMVTFLDCSKSYGNTDLYAYHWVFDDGTTSDDQNPVHTYLLPGVYKVCLTVYGTNGTESCTDEYCVEIRVDPCDYKDCNVDAGLNYLFDGCTWHFFNQSTTTGNSQIISTFWSFGDGATSTDNNPIHTYYINGNMHVCLIVEATNGRDTCSDTTCVDIRVECEHKDTCIVEANFSYTKNKCKVTFTDLSIGVGSTVITSWYWDFGDGTSSTVQNPTHTFPGPGPWHVCLYVDGLNGDIPCKDYYCVNISLPNCPNSRLAGSISKGDQNNFKVQPNPSPGKFRLIMNVVEAGPYSIMIIDSYGRLINKKEAKMPEGQTEIEYDLSTAPKGIYHIKIQNQSMQKVLKVVIN